MPVDTRHAEYDKNAPLWQKVRDCIAGEDAIKAAGPCYLPMLDGQDAEEYDAYKCRGLFYGATGRTLLGLLGAIFRKPAKTVVPKSFEARLKKVTLDGKSWAVFVLQLVEEVLTAGRLGVLADYAEGDGQTPGRSYLCAYKAEDVINWRLSPVAGDLVLDRVVLRECVSEPDPEDEFAELEVEQYRVLDLDDAGDYRQRLFRKVKDAEGKERWVQYGEDIYPTRRKVKLQYIPFVFFGPTDISPCVEKSPLLDLANANLGHWRLDVDEKHGLHYTALPTPWAAGALMGSNGQEPELRIGAGTAWRFQDSAGHAGMLEFTGQGIGAIREAKADIKAYLVHLGAQILQDQKAAAETADAMRLRSAAETSILSMLADTCSTGLEVVLGWLLSWDEAANVEVSVKVNKDFLESKLAPQTLAALVAGWQEGALTDEVLAHQLEQGEMLPPDKSADDYAAELAAAKEAKQPPPLPPQAQAALAGLQANKPANDNQPPAMPMPDMPPQAPQRKAA